jgi:hypothetical protein
LHHRQHHSGKGEEEEERVDVIMDVLLQPVETDVPAGKSVLAPWFDHNVINLS